MNEHRQHERVTANLPITASTVLEGKAGVILDISEGGAQIGTASFPKGTRIRIDYENEAVWAEVMWDEVDRMGVRFEHALRPGVLSNLVRQMKTVATFANRADAPAARGFGRRAA